MTDICQLPRKDGMCKGFMERYYFSTVTNQCVPFIYGGCGGNGNNFATMTECQDMCEFKSTNKTSSIEFVTAFPRTIADCHKPAVKGPCKSHLTMYAYDWLKDTCHDFVYGGCGGNGNRFFTMSECQSVCKNRGRNKDTSKPFKYLLQQLFQDL